jgi:hypothetical protein
MSLFPRRFARIDALRIRRFPKLPPVTALAAWLVLAGILWPVAPAQAVLRNVRVDRTSFSPNGDGIRDVVRILWEQSTPTAGVRVEIRPATATGGPYVRAFALGPSPADSVGFPADDSFVTWDGRDSSGVLLPEANYVAHVFEIDTLGVPVPLSFGFTASILDVTAPAVPEMDEGLDGLRTTASTLEFGGFAPGADSVIVFWGGAPVDTVRVAADSSFSVIAALVEGPNAIAVRGYDRAGNESPLSLAVTVTYHNTADIVLISPRPFEVSPNGDGVLDTARVLVRLDAPTTRLTVQVRASVPYLTGTTIADSVWVAILHDSAAAAGDHTFEWDGKDSTLTDVPDGSWFFFAQAESIDAAGNPVPGAGRFARTVLDRVAPSVPVPSPSPPKQTSRNSIVLTGVPVGTAVPADTVIAWRGATQVGRDTGTPWSITLPLVLGTNVFTLEGADRAGNRSPMSAPIQIVYQEPIGFHAPERFRASDVFEVNVTRTARAVLIELFTLEGRLVRHLSVTRVDQRYELPWNLLDDRGSTVGDGPYMARATVTYDDGVIESTRAAIVVAK